MGIVGSTFNPPNYQIDGNVSVASLSSDPPLGSPALVEVLPDGSLYKDGHATLTALSNAFNGANATIFSVWGQPPKNMTGSRSQLNGVNIGAWSTGVADSKQYPIECRNTLFWVGSSSQLDVSGGTWDVPANGTYRICLWAETSSRTPTGSGSNSLGGIPKNDLDDAKKADKYTKKVLTYAKKGVKYLNKRATALKEAQAAQEEENALKAELAEGEADGEIAADSEEAAELTAEIGADVEVVGAEDAAFAGAETSLGVLDSLTLALDASGILTIAGIALGIAIAALEAIGFLLKALGVLDWILSLFGENITPPEDAGLLGIFLSVNNVIAGGVIRPNYIYDVTNHDAIYDDKNYSTDIRLNLGDSVTFFLGYAGKDGIDGLACRWSATLLYDWELNSFTSLGYSQTTVDYPPLNFNQIIIPTSTEETGSKPLFGTSVAMSPDALWAVVGGTGNNSGQGAIWIYQPTSNYYYFYQLITNPGSSSSSFGTAVGIGGPSSYVIAVGDPAADSVWIFQIDLTSSSQNYIETQHISGPSGSLFGSCVVVSSDSSTIAVGAPGYDSGSGGVWVYQAPPIQTAGQYYQYALVTAALTAATPGAGCAFGTSVAISFDGQTVAASGPGTQQVMVFDYYDSPGGENGGAPLFYQVSTTNIAPPTVPTEYGNAVAMDSQGLTLFVTSMGNGDTNGVYIFLRPDTDFSFSPNPGTPFIAATSFEDSSFSSLTPSATFGTAICAASDGLGVFVLDPTNMCAFPLTLEVSSTSAGITLATWNPLVEHYSSNGSLSASGTVNSLACMQTMQHLIVGNPTYTGSVTTTTIDPTTGATTSTTSSTQAGAVWMC